MFFDPAVVATLKLKEKPFTQETDTRAREFRFTLFKREKKTRRSSTQRTYSC